MKHSPIELQPQKPALRSGRRTPIRHSAIVIFLHSLPDAACFRRGEKKIKFLAVKSKFLAVAVTTTPPAAFAVDPAAAHAAVGHPASPGLTQVFGWKEHVFINGLTENIRAKLDTGALNSSIHAEEKELFERDGKKWVRFVVTDPTVEKSTRNRIEAPLERSARIKEPGGESRPREVVKLSVQIGGRKLHGEFSLNNRSNMLSPVLIGRNMIKDLGWVDPARTFLADEKLFR